MESYKFYLFLLFSMIFLYVFKTSGRFQYYVKFSVYVYCWSVSSVLIIPLFTLRPTDYYNFVVAGKFTPIMAFLLNLKYVFRGKEYMQSKGAHVVLTNHQSVVDAIGMYLIWKFLNKCTIIVKKELAYFPPFFVTGWLTGTVFIDRSNVETTKIKMKEAGEKFKKENTKVLICPEGKRYQTGRIEPFKKGAFHLAIDCQLPIIPVVFSYYHFLGKKRDYFRPGTIIISALPPISTKGLTSKNVDELIEKTHKAMSDEFEKISKEAVSM